MRSVKRGPDGGGDDADGGAADAAADAAAFGPVDLSFVYEGAAIPDASIFIYGPDGSFVREEATDATGRKRLEDFPRGGSVYVGAFHGGAPRAASAYGVVPGDGLVLGPPG